MVCKEQIQSNLVNAWLCGNKFTWQSPNIDELSKLGSFLMKTKQLKCVAGLSIFQDDFPVTNHSCDWRTHIKKSDTTFYKWYLIISMPPILLTFLLTVETVHLKKPSLASEIFLF